MSDCPFCAIVAGTAPAVFLAEWSAAIAIKPRSSDIPGHALVIPKLHVADFGDDPALFGLVMQYAAELADGAANLITSRGAPATQTVFHLHVHVIPRQDGDGITLPWTEPA